MERSDLWTPAAAAATPRTALVTGASSGLGRAIAIELGALGWRVAIGARRVDRLEETADAVREAGGTAFAHALDVADPRSVAAFFDAAESALATIEVVVNNAGMTTPGPIADLEPEAIRRTFEINTLGSIYCAREAIRRWASAGTRDGDLVFVSSETADDPWPQNLPYAASKAAVEHVARGLRGELEGTGARVSIVQLGPALSEFGFGWDPEVFVGAVELWKRLHHLPHDGMMSGEEVARAVVHVLAAPRGVEVHDVVIKPSFPAAAEGDTTS